MDRRLFVIFVMIFSALLLALVGRPGDAPAAEPADMRAEWGFFDWMGQAAYSMDAIGDMIDDPLAGPDRLREVEELQWALLHMKAASATLELSGKSQQQFADEATARADMRRGLNAGLQAALKLEAAMLAEDMDAAKAQLAALKQTQRDMHRSHKGGGRRE